MLTLEVLVVLGIATIQGQGINSDRSLFTETITLGSADGTCGAKTECDVYQPLANQLGDETMLTFFKTAFGRLLLRYMVRCCHFEHPLLSRPDPSPSSIIPTEEECGFSAPDAALDIQKPGAWPWLVAVGDKSTGQFKGYCGGTLITKRHILSSAICLKQDTLFVRLGDFYLGRNETNSTHLELQVEKVVSPDFDSRNHLNDISILTLQQDIAFTDYIRPACLPFKQRDDNFIGDELVVVGYGDTSFGGVPSLVPLATALPVIDLAKCQTVYGNLPPQRMVNESQLCMLEDNQGPCQGDSGSPLNYFSPGSRRYYIVGIVSYGHGCGHPEYPGVYTRVGAFLDWIIANL